MQVLEMRMSVGTVWVLFLMVAGIILLWESQFSAQSHENGPGLMPAPMWAYERFITSAARKVRPASAERDWANRLNGGWLAARGPIVTYKKSSSLMPTSADGTGRFMEKRSVYL